MKLVVIESPYAGDVEANVAYAKRCMLDCIARGEAPYASHILFTQAGILDDLDAAERKLGIDAGFAWGARADVVVVYVDRGISRGMEQGIARALAANESIEFRSLDGADLANYPPLNCRTPSRRTGEAPLDEQWWSRTSPNPYASGAKQNAWNEGFVAGYDRRRSEAARPARPCEGGCGGGSYEDAPTCGRDTCIAIVRDRVLAAQVGRRVNGQVDLPCGDALGSASSEAAQPDHASLALYIVDFLRHRNRGSLKAAMGSSEDVTYMAEELIEILKHGGHPPNWVKRASAEDQSEADHNIAKQFFAPAYGESPTFVHEGTLRSKAAAKRRERGPRPAPLSEAAKKAREPLPVEVLAGALQDRVHIEAGAVRAAKSVRASPNASVANVVAWLRTLGPSPRYPKLLADEIERTERCATPTPSEEPDAAGLYHGSVHRDVGPVRAAVSVKSAPSSGKEKAPEEPPEPCEQCWRCGKHSIKGFDY